MIPLLVILIAVLSYGLGALNGAIIISRFVFQKDIRKYGSGNAGYTNFVRVFGRQWGTAVIAVDILKSAIAVMAGGLLMMIVNKDGNYVVVGKLLAGFCACLGHMYPIQHQLRGGKGVVCCMTTLWLTDWRMGLVATGVFIIVLAFAQYVSLASMCACFVGALATWVFVATENLRGLAWTLAMFMALIIIWRHRGNIIRILNNREPRVKWGRPQTPRRPKKDDFDF